ncbi:MAG: helix-turn-helix domain-containing protein [Proteobacteria bacterium]|nr:helix-turn-helix domain-containing protein [Pseudomonadota bacterium]
MSKAHVTCPVERAIEIIGGKWKIPIIYHLSQKPCRFGVLRNKLTKVTTQMLSKQLKEMEKDGLVNRKVLNVMPPSVEYSLTDFGSSALPVLRTLYQWSINQNKIIIKLSNRKSQKIELSVSN